MYQIVGKDNPDQWRNIINSFKISDIYYHPGYLKAFEENGDGEPILFFMENEFGRAANVFLLRDISKDERFKAYLEAEKYFDISTVYGYGGPVFEGDDLAGLSASYIDGFTDYCKRMNIVSEFIRFHPILRNHLFLENYYEVTNLRKTVYIDLSKGEEFVWNDFDHSNRNNIKKAQIAGINIIYGRDRFLIDEFKRLYNQTMNKDNAAEYYYFNEYFFDTTMTELKENALIFGAVLEDKIIAACIVIFSKEFVHCHFLASDKNYLDFRPNNLLIYEAALWGCRGGKKLLHLGGGVKGDDDNLFRFKKSFSKTNRLSFYIGKKVYDEVEYNKLIQLRSKIDENFDRCTDYFPRYRG